MILGSRQTRECVFVCLCSCWFSQCVSYSGPFIALSVWRDRMWQSDCIAGRYFANILCVKVKAILSMHISINVFLALTTLVNRYNDLQISIKQQKKHKLHQMFRLIKVGLIDCHLKTLHYTVSCIICINAGVCVQFNYKVMWCKI